MAIIDPESPNKEITIGVERARFKNSKYGSFEGLKLKWRPGDFANAENLKISGVLEVLPQ